jgi:Winged helix-turn helix
VWTSSAALAITPENRLELERIVRSGKTEQRIGLRARIVLGAADGKSNNALAKELKTSRPTVLDWRQRFAEGGIKALYGDRPRGRSFKPLARSKEAEVIDKTQSAPSRPHNGVAAAWPKSAASAKHPCSASGMPTV